MWCFHRETDRNACSTWDGAQQPAGGGANLPACLARRAEFFCYWQQDEPKDGAHMSGPMCIIHNVHKCLPHLLSMSCCSSRGKVRLSPAYSCVEFHAYYVYNASSILVTSLWAVLDDAAPA